MEAKVVYERRDDFDTSYGPYGGGKVGVLIEDRVIWLAVYSYPAGRGENEDFEKWEKIAKRIADSLVGYGVASTNDTGA